MALFGRTKQQALAAIARTKDRKGRRRVGGGQGNIVPAVSPLRFVTTQNRMASGLGTVPANRSAWDFRMPYVIASGDVDGIVFTWTNQNPAAPDSTALSPIVLNDVYIENSNATAAKQLSLDGQSYPYTLVSGANDIRHVKLLPSDLGVSVFTPGDTLYVKGRGSMTPGMQFPNMADRIPVSDASKILWTLYDPTATTPSALSTPGVQTVVSGAAFPITSSGGFCPFALGTFVQPLASRKPTFAGFGDSNLFGFRDTALLYHGKGEFQRMLTGNGTNSDLMAGGNFSVTGYTIQQINHPKIIYWSQFADKIIDEVLVNSFGSTGVTDQATIRPIKQALWDAYKSANPNATVYSCDVGPRTNGAWTLADQSDQTYFAGFGPGGNIETFRTWFIAQAGLPNTYNTLVQFTAWRGSPDPLKWPGGGLTDDGTHALSTTVAAKAAQLRSIVLS
jgi:hypothetical protein